MESEELIIRVLQGQATPSERARLSEWRARSLEHEARYQEIAQLWRELEEPEIASVPPTVDEILTESARRSRQGGSVWRRWPILAAAASLLLAVGIGRQFATLLENRGTALEPLDLATSAVETKLIQLSDGTLVHLAPGSRLQTVPAPHGREVWLEGRAFFGVAKREGSTFVVRSPAGEVEVLGTRFELSTREGEARVVVVDGRVSLSLSGHDLQLAARQMVEAADSAAPVVRQVEDLEAVLAWMGRSLVFHDTPLRQAAEEIQTRYGGTIEVTDPTLAEQTISGGFHDRSFDQVLRTICQVLSADCLIQGAYARISPVAP